MTTEIHNVNPKVHRTLKEAAECKCGNRGPICFAAWANCNQCKVELIGDDKRAGLCAGCAEPITKTCGLDPSWICVACRGRCSGWNPPLCFKCDPTNIYNLKLDGTPTDDAPAPIEFRGTDHSGLPFNYTDDICQIGEHDVCFSGVQLTNDIGEFKTGQKFASAVIDFQGGHLTLEMHDDREHRYSFALKVGTKHEGHTCTGCPGKIGEPCRQHS